MSDYGLDTWMTFIIRFICDRFKRKVQLIPVIIYGEDLHRLSFFNSE